jgi:hypothetical protein
LQVGPGPKWDVLATGANGQCYVSNGTGFQNSWQNLAGDVTGACGSNVVGAIQGHPFTSSSLATGDIFYYNGTIITHLAASSTSGSFLQSFPGSNPSWYSGSSFQGSGGDNLQFGGSPASAGAVRLSNNMAIKAHSATSGDVQIANVDSSDNVTIGDTAKPMVLQATQSTWQTVVSYQGTVSTTNATATTILTIPLSANTTYRLTTSCNAVTTGGAGGTVGDSWTADLYASYKRVGAGPVAVGTNPGVVNQQSDTSINAATISFSVSSNNILEQVTGVSTIDLDWRCSAQAMAVN